MLKNLKTKLEENKEEIKTIALVYTTTVAVGLGAINMRNHSKNSQWAKAAAESIQATGSYEYIFGSFKAVITKV